MNLTGTTATIHFFDPEDKLVLGAATIYKPRDVARFLRTCREDDDLRKRAEAGGDVSKWAAVAPELAVQCAPDRVRDRAAWPKNAAARAAWLTCFEFKSTVETSRFMHAIERRLYRHPAYALFVGPGKGNLGFQLYDRAGKVVPRFTLLDAPADDVEALVGGPDLIASLAAM